MIRALYTASTGMKAQELAIDVISNNLANVNTTGYKKSRAEFQDLMYQYLLDPGAPTSQNTTSPSGIGIGLGVKAVSVQKIFTQGDLTSTGRELDIAIEGDGFIPVLLPDGTQVYTRSGSFQLNENGEIVTPDGFPLAAGITIPSDALSIVIGQDGTVSVRVPGSTAPSQVGQIQGVRFPNNAGLRAIGKNLYEETVSSGSPVTGTFGENGLGRLNQGFLETSNVSVVEQVVSMITAQRAYEATSRTIQAADDMLTQAINLRR
ncbi:MAG: flagellar basal-body rod protein FlgG [Candidatus Dadabacteria bacterium]|nr:MAG: flagellar basal-body rod protein FlgG [Candidatus Dadabacteria bacterium]